MIIDNSFLKNSKGIFFGSAKGTSGYADAGKRILNQLCQHNIPISWRQFSIDGDKFDETDILYQNVKKTLNKNIEFDTAIFCCTPDVWFEYIEKFKIKFINKKLIGYVTWETNKISNLWVKFCNLMNEIWVPSRFNKDIFERCGVDVPVKIVAYPENIQSLPEINSDSIIPILMKSKWYGNKTKLFRYDSNWKIFYTIGEWNDRKNMENTIKTFCKAFNCEDRVKLVIKTFHINYSESNKNYCKNKLETILQEYPNHPEILLITDNISEYEIRLIHSFGDCFYSLTRGEGFCLGCFDAFNYKKDIVITNWGGHVEYLGENYKGLVDSNLINVNFKERESLYSEDQKWADPNLSIAVDRLRDVYLKSVFSTSKILVINQSLSDEKTTEESKNDSVLIDSENKNTKINLVKIKIKSDFEFTGITYIGQYGTSGYATAAKGNLVHFFTQGIPISWIPLYFDNSQLSDDCFYNAMVKSLINKPIETFNTVIFHSTPDTWPDLIAKNTKLIQNKKIIGYAVWETTQLPLYWVDNINEYVDEVWCPSSYNKTVFENSGVTIPIKVFPHIFMGKKLPKKNNVVIEGYNEIIEPTNDYTFYNISELNIRKGIEDLIETFCNTFTNKDGVRLILKLHYKNYGDFNKKKCINIINKILANYDNPPRIYYILDNLTEQEILGLHSLGDCYVSLCKCEGFGLTIFDAFNYEKKIITTGYGGQIDFLGSNYKGLVDYKLGDITGMENWNPKYEGQWAYPDLKHAGELMRQNYGNGSL